MGQEVVNAYFKLRADKIDKYNTYVKEKVYTTKSIGQYLAS